MNNQVALPIFEAITSAKRNTIIVTIVTELIFPFNYNKLSIF